MTQENPVPPGVDMDKPNVARAYDYALGGKDNFAVDRAFADKFFAMVPSALADVRQNREFLVRAVRFLAREKGVRQFIDIGTGLPTQENVHEVAHAVAPDARVVYADYDPIVSAHGDALLAGDDRVAFIQADLRRPEDIIDHPDTRALIDFDEPVAVLLAAVLHFVTDEEGPDRIVARLRDALPPGGYLAVSHVIPPPGVADLERLTAVIKGASAPYVLRTREEILRFFDGLDLLAPGLVPPLEWHADTTGGTDSENAMLLVGLGRKPG
ncbi:SAM-dependent methyltransferase [Actinorugispora endophytica]|uniref:SAM-dependent methyltransferase n=1 Tax=Actinorugispora endophytica TaxID=1605990 RepID=UPI00106087D9|nr:SAM-dependent methyltransferase [Actinorugispora endophytica]